MYKTGLLFFYFISFYASAIAQSKDSLVRVGQHALAFYIQEGHGVPIVFEAGGGSPASVWQGLVAPLAAQIKAPLIRYDRAGFGQSGLDSLRIGIHTEVEDLNNALTQLGYPGPYLFVAHSLGGNYTMKFIDKYPGKVLGAVFIDIVPPAFMTAKRATNTKKLFLKDIEEIKRESKGFYHLVLNYEETSAVLRAVAPDIKIPSIVIASGISPFEGRTAKHFIQGLKQFGQAEENRSYVLVPHASHDVHIDEPQLVTDEIVKLYKHVIKE